MRVPGGGGLPRRGRRDRRRRLRRRTRRLHHPVVDLVERAFVDQLRRALEDLLHVLRFLPLGRAALLGHHAEIERPHLHGDVRQHAVLRGDLVLRAQLVECREDLGGGLRGVGRGVHADDRVAATVRKAVDCAHQDAREVVGRVVRLHADAEHAAFAERVPAPRHVPNLRSDVH